MVAYYHRRFRTSDSSLRSGVVSTLVSSRLTGAVDACRPTSAIHMTAGVVMGFSVSKPA